MDDRGNIRQLMHGEAPTVAEMLITGDEAAYLQGFKKEDRYEALGRRRAHLRQQMKAKARRKRRAANSLAAASRRRNRR